METFSALLTLCAGNSPVNGELPSQRPVTRSFDVFFDLGLNKRLSEQSRRWLFEAPSCSLWRHCNAVRQSQNLYCSNVTEKHRGLYSLNGKTSYLKISCSIEAARLDVIIIGSLRNLTGISAGRLEKSKPESRGFETSRGLAVRRLAA